jgi:hypothetical protein
VASAETGGGGGGAAAAAAAGASSPPATLLPQEGEVPHAWEVVLRNVYNASVPRPPIYYEELELEVT